MTKTRVIIMWGIITGVVEIIFYQLLNLSGNTSGGLQSISYLILLGGLIGGMMQFRNKVNGGYATFGELYKVGMLMTLILSVITVAHLLIYMQINPGFIDKILDQARVNMVNKGMTDDQIKMGMHYTQMFTTPLMMSIFGFIGNIIGGAILGLLAAGILAKQKPFMEEDNNTLPS
ncbi:MAG TPA: DUF4199 domain-containing protein [Bacteroidia bacterium]|jgi:hypothetical protein|nr:DUF4199 domain-containing protein [Bacteroidia bacterium]